MIQEYPKRVSRFEKDMVFHPERGHDHIVFKKWSNRQVYTYYKTFGIVDGGNYGDKSMCYSYQLKPCAHHSTSAKYPNCTSSEATPKCARKCLDNGANWRSSKHYGSGGYSVCQQGDSKCSDAMMQEIYQNGPITGMFFVHQSFFSWGFKVFCLKHPFFRSFWICLG